MAFALQNRWTRSDSGTATGLEDAVHAARLVGAEPELVLAGGGNTSVKVQEDGREVMYVKGSGADLAGVTGKDYTPLALQPVRALLATDLPDNRAMYEALAPLVLRADAPRPSIETLMHAGIAAPHVIHTHAASVLAIANTRDCARHLQAAFGAGMPVAPYRHSGLELARACVAAGRQAMAHRPGAMVLAHHGAVTWGNSAREAYEAMLDLANRAEHYLEAQGVSHRGGATQASPSGATPFTSSRLSGSTTSVALTRIPSGPPPPSQSPTLRSQCPANAAGISLSVAAGGGGSHAASANTNISRDGRSFITPRS